MRGDIQVTAVRTDTNQVIMDLIMEDLQWNATVWSNATSTGFINEPQAYEFMSAKLVQRGRLVKDERDIWKMKAVLDNLFFLF